MLQKCYIEFVEKGELAAWFEKKYLNWEQENGRASIVKFAEWLGYSSIYITHLMNGVRKKVSQKTALKIAQRIGDFEIMDICGYARPDPADLLANFPPAVRDPILAALSEAQAALVKRGKLEAGPEAEAIIKAAFDKYGVKVTFTNKSS